MIESSRQILNLAQSILVDRPELTKDNIKQETTKIRAVG